MKQIVSLVKSCQHKTVQKDLFLTFGGSVNTYNQTDFPSCLREALTESHHYDIMMTHPPPTFEIRV